MWKCVTEFIPLEAGAMWKCENTRFWKRFETAKLLLRADCWLLTAAAICENVRLRLCGNIRWLLLSLSFYLLSSQSWPLTTGYWLLRCNDCNFCNDCIDCNDKENTKYEWRNQKYELMWKCEDMGLRPCEAAPMWKYKMITFVFVLLSFVFSKLTTGNNSSPSSLSPQP